MDIYLNKQSTIVFTIVSYILCDEHNNANNNVAEASLEVSLIAYTLNEITECLPQQLVTSAGNLEGISRMKLSYSVHMH